MPPFFGWIARVHPNTHCTGIDKSKGLQWVDTEERLWVAYFQTVLASSPSTLLVSLGSMNIAPIMTTVSKTAEIRKSVG